MRRRIFTAILGISCSAGLCLLACSDDDPATAADAGGSDAGNADTSMTNADTGTKTDGNSPIVDSGTDSTSPPSDSGNDADADAGPTRTVETKSTGLIRLADLFAQARFSEDDTVIHWSNAAECITVVRSASKPYSTAGTVTINGQIIGSDGGPTDPIELTAPDYYFDGLVLPPTSEFTVDVTEAPGNPAFPELAKQTIRPSSSVQTTILQPLADAGSGNATVPPNKALTITWTPPAGDISEQRFALDLALFPSGADGSKNVEVICDTALSAGTFTLPAELMTDALAQTLPVAGVPASGLLTVLAGGQKTVSVKSAVYVITAATDDSTTASYTNLSFQ